MKAVRVHQFGELDAVGLENVPDPVPNEHEVLIEVRAVPVNYVDGVTFRGEYQFVPVLPYTPGKGPAGVVRAVGASVKNTSVGERVLAMAEYGGHAELVAVDSQHVYELPSSLSYTDAAAMSLSYDTAWMALRDRARIEVGDSVLVLGASGAVGQAAVQLALAMKAGLVLGGVSDMGRPAGPVHGVVDLSRGDLRDTVREQVLEATDGRGVDIVIDPLGGDAFDGAVRSLAWRGRLVIIGFATGRIPTLKMNYPMLKNIEISGLQISDYRKRWPELVSKCYQEIFDYYEQEAIAPPSCEVLPLHMWRAAIQAVASGGRQRTIFGPIAAHPHGRSGSH